MSYDKVTALQDVLSVSHAAPPIVGSTSPHAGHQHPYPFLGSSSRDAGSA